MSEQDFEHWLRLLGRMLRFSESQRDEIRRELRDHLETQLAHLMSRGISREDAIAQALDEFGDAAALAHDLSKLNVRRKWIMRSTMGIGIAAAAALMVSVFVPGTPNRAQVAIGQDVRPETRPAVLPTIDVTVLMKEAVTLRQNHRYAETLDILNKVLEFDAKHTRARWMADDLKFVVATVQGLKNLDENAATSEIRKKLSIPVPAIEFSEGTSFVDAIEFLRESTGLNIVVNWAALENAGLERDATVSMSLKDMKLSKVLDILLAKAGANGRRTLVVKPKPVNRRGGGYDGAVASFRCSIS